LEPGVGEVPNPTGSRAVIPQESTNYKITAWGLGGVASDTQLVNVDTPAPPPRGSDLIHLDTWLTPTPPPANQPFQAFFTYGNAGPDTSPEFDVVLQLDGGETFKKRQGPLQAGARAQVVWQLPGLPAGDHHIDMHLDPGGEVNDPRRDNNFGTNGF